MYLVLDSWNNNVAYLFSRNSSIYERTYVGFIAFMLTLSALAFALQISGYETHHGDPILMTFYLLARTLKGVRNIVLWHYAKNKWNVDFLESNTFEDDLFRKYPKL